MKKQVGTIPIIQRVFVLGLAAFMFFVGLGGMINGSIIGLAFFIVGGLMLLGASSNIDSEKTKTHNRLFTKKKISPAISSIVVNDIGYYEEDDEFVDEETEEIKEEVRRQLKEVEHDKIQDAIINQINELRESVKGINSKTIFKNDEKMRE